MYAARKDDLLLHPPLAAELFAMATEAVIYAAATAAVGAAIGFAVGATIGTCGAAGPLIPIVAGALVAAASMIPVEEGKSIGDAITGFSEGLADKLFPAEPFGKVSSGSEDTYINGKQAARAAGISLGAPVAPPEPAQEPSVLETVGSYAMIGASMMLPIIGLAQEINDIFNPPVTTPADPNTQPTPLDTVTCTKHPPMPEQFVAQGSDKVFINGQPAAREGDKSTCDGKIGLQVSPNVRIGGGTLTVRDITDGKSALAKITGLVVGMLLARKGLKGMRCGRVGSPVEVPSGSKVLDGPDDLDFSLPGMVALEWQRQYDSSDQRRDGLFGLGWSVAYESRLERVAHPQGGELWIYVDPQGSRIELGRLQVGSAFVSVLDGLAFYHQEGGVTVVEDIHQGLYQTFQVDPLAAHRSRLVKLGDRNLNTLELFYDPQGRLQYLGDTGSRSFAELRYDPVHPGRVSDVQRLFMGPGENLVFDRRECLVSYRYDTHGQLEAVCDALGQVVRRFTYTDHGLMASHMQPSGVVRHYQWQRFTTPLASTSGQAVGGSSHDIPPLLEPQPEHHWRVVGQQGSGGERYSFVYDLGQRHARVIDGLGREEHYYWGPYGEVHTYIDAQGLSSTHEYIGGLLRRSVDVEGREWRFAYDPFGRCIATTDPLGRTESVQYMAHWALPLTISDGAGRVRRFSYDRHGNLVREVDPLGHETRFVHDSQGRVEQVIDADGKSRRLSWSEQSQVLAYRDCSGQETRYCYDERGNPSEVVNARGERSRYRHDARGYLIESKAPDGRVDQYQVDGAGLVVQHRDPASQLTRWHYDQAGRLLQRTDSLGHTLRLEWDCYGRLRQLENPNGEHYRFEWDALDRISRQQNLDGGGFSYHYSPAGDLAGIRQYPARDTDPDWPDSLEQVPVTVRERRFEYDAVGRLVRKHTDDGVTDYRYDAADNLIALSFTDHEGAQQQLGFAYDALDQLVEEHSANGVLEYRYDALGNLQTLTLADQRKINHLYYGNGHLHQVNLDGRVICDFERDQVHDEILRTQGRLQTRTRRDGNGRISQRALLQLDSAGAMPLLQKDYHYNALDNLVGERFTQTQSRQPGREHLEVIGRFTGGHSGPGSHSCQAHVHRELGPSARIHGLSRRSSEREAVAVETYAYDKAGNLLDGYPVNGLVRHDRVRVHEDKRFRYDAYGRLLEKRSGRYLVQHFDYDAEDRLVQVRQQRGNLRETVRFSYDPLGRRTAKYLYRDDHAGPISQTFFSWQGMRLLQEIQNGQPSLYLYEDSDSHEPLARIDGAPGAERVRYFHNNLSGLPEQLTDEQGLSLWRSDYRAWGLSEDEWHDGHEPVRQNLRMQGQYLDRETGLHYNTLRYYDPDIGRFTQPDPLGLAGGFNLYLYSPNASDWIDPLGLNPCRIKKPRISTLSDLDFLKEIARRAERHGVRKGWGAAGTGGAQGSRKHKYAHDLIERYQRRYKQRQHLESEKSWYQKRKANYSDKGSARPDIRDTNTNEIYDFKFTKNANSPISTRQQNHNIKHVPGVTSSTPQTAIHP
ncbi:RHS repeat-associated core domain-containing protein [Pseudomonas mosselii]|uniref:RHS repeat-associated core domain-containing protein n=1 Tax=Pseudomonas mosselii TaxID=78327 RepID=UPI000D9F89BE|nr:RHS repeat-associated core domain-containing protein [Pseudomonas mosselii]PYC21271.1 type IV secretion protein Rhs [Pseudomonas mosselii]